MKKLVFLCFVFCWGLNQGWALSGNEINLQFGAGLYGSRGLLGLSGEKFLTENHAISAAIGIDVIGLVSTAGYKYFGTSVTPPKPQSFFDKCFFLFECEELPYLGLQMQNGNGANIRYSQTSYILGSSTLALASMGIRNIFKNKMTLDLEFSYRKRIEGGSLQQTLGPLTLMKSMELTQRSILRVLV